MNKRKIIIELYMLQPEIEQCKIENQKPDARFHILSLTNMSFSFAILGLGIGLAVWSFAVEFLYKWILKKTRNNHRNVMVIASKNKTEKNDKPVTVENKWTNVEIEEIAPQHSGLMNAIIDQKGSLTEVKNKDQSPSVIAPHETLIVVAKIEEPPKASAMINKTSQLNNLGNDDTNKISNKQHIDREFLKKN